MMIERGSGRGFITDDNDIKVSLKPGEGVWVKVIAMRDDKLAGIGILENTPVDNDLKWGDIVLFEEDKKNEIPIIITKISKIPDTDDWGLDF